MSAPKRETTRLKYIAINKRFDVLYNDKRIRYDDCIKKIMQEFFIQHPNTVSRILASDV